MRVLDFNVDRQTISKSDTCDFSGLIAGSSGYLFARFKFSQEWTGYHKVAVFSNKSGEYPTKIRGGICEVPAEALTEDMFKVTVIGKRGSKYLPCDSTSVNQRRV